MSQSETGLLRMRDVCARTGLTRSTIHHYIREGVLPRPAKTGRNTALYDEDFVRRAHLVKALQEKTHMPLASIRDALKDVPPDAVETIDLARFTTVTRAVTDTLRLASEQELTKEELAKQSSLSTAQIDGLARAHLIDPIQRGKQMRYSPLDAQVVMAYARIAAAGASTERGFGGSSQIVKAYRRYLTELARVEAKEMLRLMPALAEMDAHEFVQQVEGPLGEFIAALHRKALAQAIVELSNNGQS